MSKEELKKLVKVIPVTKDSTNLIFMNIHSITEPDAIYLSKLIKKAHKSDFGALVMVNGPPDEAVKLISAKDLTALSPDKASK